MANDTRRLIVDHVRRHYADRNPRDIRISADGAVNVTLDRMHNTDRPGRVFAGWDKDLLAEARAIAEQERAAPAPAVRSITPVLTSDRGYWTARVRFADGRELFAAPAYTMHQAQATCESIRRAGVAAYADDLRPLPDGVRVVRARG